MALLDLTFVDALIAQGHEVTVIDDLSSGKRENLHPKATLVVGSIRYLDFIREVFNKDIDGCFHLAAQASIQKSNEEWFETHTVNSAGAVNIFDACQRNGVPFVYASSAAVYGPSERLPLCETESANPVTSYGVDKYSNELNAKVAHAIHNTPNVGLRIFNAYGPRQEPSSLYSGVISVFIKQALEGRPLTIEGTGQQFRDFIYIADVVKGFVAAMESLHKQDQSAEIYNVCTGRQTSLLQLTECIEKIMGTPLGKTFGVERTGDIQRSLGNPEKMISHLGVRAETSLQEGLATTIFSIADERKRWLYPNAHRHRPVVTSAVGAAPGAQARAAAAATAAAGGGVPGAQARTGAAPGAGVPGVQSQAGAAPRPQGASAPARAAAAAGGAGTGAQSQVGTQTRSGTGTAPTASGGKSGSKPKS